MQGLSNKCGVPDINQSLRDRIMRSRAREFNVQKCKDQEKCNYIPRDNVKLLVIHRYINMLTERLG
jgi:hypothetical protein